MLKKVRGYIQGWFRYRLYYSKNVKFLMRRHIVEQIDYRISVMNKECLSTGSCIHCGCKTTALQMANYPCEGACYDKMLSKKKWNVSKNNDGREKVDSKGN